MTVAELQFLTDASRTFASALRRFDDAIASVADQAVPMLGDWCFIDLVDDCGVLTRRAAAGPGVTHTVLPLAAREDFAAGDQALPWEAIHSGRTVHIDAPDEATVSRLAPSELSAAALRARTLTSILVVPLTTDQLTGAISLCSADPARHPPSRVLEVAEEYARHASLALANARRLQEARRASRMKDELLATVSHELRTPLNAMLGWLWMLRHHQMDGERMTTALDSIERGAHASAKLIDDLLDLSQVLTGRVTLNRDDVDLGAIVRDVVDGAQPAAEKKGLTLAVTARQAAPLVRGDRERLRQILTNLLSNAVRFTPDGGRIDVEVAAAGAYTEVIVKDSGIGIAAHVLPTIFDRFRRADHSVPRGGLGLGLAVVQQLVQLHGGQVAVDSPGVGRGSTFTVRLPAAPTETRPAKRAAVDVGHGGLDGARILLVDDDADNLEVLAYALRSAGAAVTDVDSVEKAIAAFHAGKVDVVVTDIAMPDRDGFTLLDEIRHMATHARVPVVAVSAHARVEDRERGSAAGFAAYMSKPINPDLLVRTVTDVLGALPR